VRFINLDESADGALDKRQAEPSAVEYEPVVKDAGARDTEEPDPEVQKTKGMVLELIELMRKYNRPTFTLIMPHWEPNKTVWRVVPPLDRRMGEMGVQDRRGTFRGVATDSGGGFHLYASDGDTRCVQPVEDWRKIRYHIEYCVARFFQ
jgi:hypothetical protein